MGSLLGGYGDAGRREHRVDEFRPAPARPPRGGAGAPPRPGAVRSAPPSCGSRHPSPVRWWCPGPVSAVAWAAPAADADPGGVVLVGGVTGGVDGSQMRSSWAMEPSER
ncbi:hypothetical protein JOD57_004053 [Geodermatophilus bullaregiensis]|nr:hypothetical protein [Geodermatophilus bullaregiensis]